MYDRKLITPELIAELSEKRRLMREEGFAHATPIIGEDGVAALKELYSLYDEGIYLWLADLWEPDIGAFYYSNSARDTEGFLPDIESTVQALRYIKHSGLEAALGGPYEKNLPLWMQKKVSSFAKSLQDPDGYFYHPQWGKGVGTSRRSRDLGWAIEAITDFGFKPNYPTPLDKKEGEEKPSALLPDHLRSTDAFRDYLSGLKIIGNSYSVGNLISSQSAQIEAAGREFIDILVDWFEKQQNPKNGTWEKEVTFTATNGLMKVTLTYSSLGLPFPNAEAAMDSAVKMTLSPIEAGQITSYYNPWITMQMLMDNLSRFGRSDVAEALRKKLKENAAAMIRNTIVKVKAFQKPEGCFSYNPHQSAPTSQGAPVAIPGTNEGDINGNGLGSTGITNHVCKAIGIPPVPLFCKEDGELYFRLLESAVSTKKIYPPISFD